MNKPLAVFALVLALCIGAASAQIQRGPVLPPTEQQQRAQDAFRRQQADEAARAAEAERQRLEEINRQREADRNRTHYYHVTCRVTGIIVRDEHVVISCHDLRNRLRNTGQIYARDEYGGSYASAYVNFAPNPTFATLAAEVASISYAERSRLRIEMRSEATDPQLWLTQISIDRGEGCAPACPP